MGLATIIEHLGEGRYRIWPEYDWSRLEAELAHLNAKDAAMEEKQQQTAQDIELQIGRVNVIVDDLNRAIEKWKAGEIGEKLGDPEASLSGDLYSSGKLEKIEAPKVPGVPEEIYSLTKKYAEEKIKLEGLREEQAAITAGFVTREQRRIALGNERKRIEGKEIAAWCADYSTEIAPMTKVRTIEVPGYRLKGEPSMVIAPGGSGTSGVKYGQLRSALTMTPEAVFLNAALEPGHLKWRPRWRYGQITWISESEDVCNVALEQEWGRRVDVAPKMPLNEADALENVPIRYMTCNRAAFEVGDQVVVEWSGDQPAVIGFRREPKECIPVIQFPPHVALKAKIGGVDDFLYILAVGEMEVSGSGVITYTFSSNSCDIGERYAAVVRKGGGVKGEWIFFETEFSLSVDVDAEIQLFPNNFNSNAERIILDTASHESLDEYTASNDYFIASPVAYYYPGTQIVQYYVWRWSRQTQNITLTKAPCSSNQNIIKWDINGFRTAFTHASENMDEFWEQMNNIPDSITVTHNQSGRNLTYQKGFVDGDHLYYIRPES